LIFLPTTVQTDPALGALGAASAKVVGFIGAVRVLFIVIGWEALRPGCEVLAVGFDARYSARHAERDTALALTMASLLPAARISSSVGRSP